MRRRDKETVALGLLTYAFVGLLGVMAMFTSPKKAEACCGAAAAIQQQTTNDAQLNRALIQEIQLTKDKLTDVIKDTGNRINSGIAASAQAEMEQNAQMFNEKANMATIAVCDGGVNSSVSKAKTEGDAMSAMQRALDEKSTQIASALSKATTGNDKKTKIKRASVDNHATMFCSDADVANKACLSAVAPKLQNADIRADNLFEPEYTPEQQKGAISFVSNLAMTNATVPISKNPDKKDITYKDTRVKQLEVSAYNSIPIKIFADIISERTKDLDSGNQLQSIFGTTNSKPSVISVMREYSTMDWAELAAKSGKTMQESEYRVATLKTMGFQNFLLVKQYEQLQKNGAALAALLSLQLEPKKKALEDAIVSKD